MYSQVESSPPVSYTFLNVICTLSGGSKEILEIQMKIMMLHIYSEPCTLMEFIALLSALALEHCAYISSNAFIHVLQNLISV